MTESCRAVMQQALEAQPVNPSVLWKPTEAAIAALKRFEETCSDGEGYDLPNTSMHELATIGLVYKMHGETYSITDFGNNVLAETTIAQPVQQIKLSELAKRKIFDSIRYAYDTGYSDSRNAQAVSGDSAPGYKGREIESDQGAALFTCINTTLAQPVPLAVNCTIRPDVITVNLMRLAGLDKHTARECESIVLQIIESISQPVQTPTQVEIGQNPKFTMDEWAAHARLQQWRFDEEPVNCDETGSHEVLPTPPDRQAFICWAKRHGVLNTELAKDFVSEGEIPVCENGWIFATYRSAMTEIAWRAWANSAITRQIVPSKESK